MFFRAGDLFDATGKFTSWESARIYGLASPVPESVLEYIPEEIKDDINEVRKMQHLLNFFVKKILPCAWTILPEFFVVIMVNYKYEKMYKFIIGVH